MHEGRVQAVSLCHQLRQVLLFHSADFVRPPARLRAPCAGRTFPPSCSPTARPPQLRPGSGALSGPSPPAPQRAEAVRSLPAGRAAVPRSSPGRLAPAAWTGGEAGTGLVPPLPSAHWRVCLEGRGPQRLRVAIGQHRTSVGRTGRRRGRREESKEGARAFSSQPAPSGC